jgi:hypothetical protein
MAAVCGRGIVVVVVSVAAVIWWFCTLPPPPPTPTPSHYPFLPTHPQRESHRDLARIQAKYKQEIVAFLVKTESELNDVEKEASAFYSADLVDDYVHTNFAFQTVAFWWRCAYIFLFVVGVGLWIVGIAMQQQINEDFLESLLRAVIFEGPEGDTYEIWRDEGLPHEVNYDSNASMYWEGLEYFETWYLYNITNQEDVLSGSSMPIVKECGPYRFRRYFAKQNVTFSAYPYGFSWVSFLVSFHHTFPPPPPFPFFRHLPLFHTFLTPLAFLPYCFSFLTSLLLTPQEKSDAWVSFLERNWFVHDPSPVKQIDKDGNVVWMESGSLGDNITTINFGYLELMQFFEDVGKSDDFLLLPLLATEHLQREAKKIAAKYTNSIKPSLFGFMSSSEPSARFISNVWAHRTAAVTYAFQTMGLLSSGEGAHV